MKTQFLLPHSFKAIGLVLLIPALVLGVMVQHFDFYFDFLTWYDFRGPTGGWLLDPEDQNFTNELAGIVLIFALLFIGFAKLKTEDEYIMKIRLDSLKWGIYVNYFLLVLGFLFAYNLDFYTVLVYNLFTPLIIYIVRFHFYLWKR